MWRTSWVSGRTSLCGGQMFFSRSSVRTWLHTIANRVGLDASERRGRRALPMDLGPASDETQVDSPMLTDVAWQLAT